MQALFRFFVITNFVLILILPPPTIEAADPEVDLEVIATTPTRIEEAVEEVSGSVTVITETTLDLKRPEALPDVLRNIPSANMTQSGSIGEQAVIRLRGAEPYQSLILLDGIRLNTPFRGFFDLGNFMMENIGQIEIIGGAQSALYGSEAMGGVINIKTRAAHRKQEGFIFSEGGSFRTFQEGFGIGGNPDWGNYTITLTRTDSEGEIDRDRFGATTFSSRLQLDLSPNSKIILIPRYQKDKKELVITPIEVANPFRFAYDDNNEIERSFLSNVLELQHTIQPGWDVILRSGFVQTTTDWENPPTSGDPDNYSLFVDSTERKTSVDLQQNFTWREHQVFTIGFEYLHDQVDDDFTLGFLETTPGGPIQVLIEDPIETSRQNRAVYLQQLLKSDQGWTLQLGARIDDNSTFGTVVTPKISSSYKIQNLKSKVRGSWGRGYRVPTIQELQSDFFGNPDLDPEKSQNWEVGLNQGLYNEIIVVDITYFSINFDELIERRPMGSQNIGEAEIRGTEAGLSIHPHPMFELNSHYFLLDTEKESTGEELDFRSRHRANINVQFIPLIQLTLNVDFNVVSSKKIPFEFILPDGSILQDNIPGYERLDLGIMYEFLEGLFFARNARAYLRVNNLLDEDYMEVPGFPAPGRQITAGINANF